MRETEYQKKIKVSLPECDIGTRMKISDVMRHIQQISSEHIEELGIGHQVLLEKGFVYLLTKVRLSVNRRPWGNEKVVIRTEPRTPKGVQSLRDVIFESEAGERLITAQTAWVLTDPVQHKIRRPSELPFSIPVKPLEGEYEVARSKIRRPEDCQAVGTRIVRYSDIDCNMHMNNAVYSDIVCDFLPIKLHKECELSEYEINFVGEAGLEEELTVLLARISENTFYIGADHMTGARCFDVVASFQAKK